MGLAGAQINLKNLNTANHERGSSLVFKATTSSKTELTTALISGLKMNDASGGHLRFKVANSSWLTPATAMSIVPSKKVVVGNETDIGHGSDGDFQVVKESHGHHGGAITQVNIVDTNGDRGSSHFFVINDGSSYQEAAKIVGRKHNNTSGGYLEFSTNGASWTGMAKRLRITPTGQLLPGTTETQDLGAAGSEWRDIYTENAVTVSDERYKEDINDTTLGLDFINKLRPVSYVRKNLEEITNTVVEEEHKKELQTVTAEKKQIVFEDGKYVEKNVTETSENLVSLYENHPLYNENGEVIGTHSVPVMETREKEVVVQNQVKHIRKHQGLLAQEVKQALDEMAIDTKDFAGYVDSNIKDNKDRLSLRYSEFIAPVIKAIQELTIKMEQIERRINNVQ